MQLTTWSLSSETPKPSYLPSICFSFRVSIRLLRQLPHGVCMRVQFARSRAMACCESLGENPGLVSNSPGRGAFAIVTQLCSALVQATTSSQIAGYPQSITGMPAKTSHCSLLSRHAKLRHKAKVARPHRRRERPKQLSAPYEGNANIYRGRCQRGVYVYADFEHMKIRIRRGALPGPIVRTRRTRCGSQP